jgi:phenylalanyl-tRNA synthetase beta chain
MQYRCGVRPWRWAYAPRHRPGSRKNSTLRSFPRHYKITAIHPEATIASPLIQEGSIDTKATSISIEKAYIDDRMGIVMDAKEIAGILKRLQFTVRAAKNVFTVEVPTFRAKDIALPIDIVEEVARIYGYDRIEPSLPTVMLAQPMRHDAMRLERELKRVLVRNFNYDEVYTYSFADQVWTERLGLDQHVVRVQNPLRPELSYLRTSLLPQLTPVALENARRYEEVRVFELGRIFSNEPGEFIVDPATKQFLPHQPRMIAGMVISKTPMAETQFRMVKGMLQQLCESVNITLSFKSTTLPHSSTVLALHAHGKDMGAIGMFRDTLTSDAQNRAMVWWEMDFEFLVKYATFSKEFRQLPRYPSIERDMAIVVDRSVSWESVESVVRASSPLMRSVQLFDIFESPKLGSDKKSLAFSLTFMHDDRTLTSEEVEVIMKDLVKSLQKSCGAQVR